VHSTERSFRSKKVQTCSRRRIWPHCQDQGMVWPILPEICFWFQWLGIRLSIESELHIALLRPKNTESTTSYRDHKSIFVVPIDSHVSPLEIPLDRGGNVFWLDPRTVALVVGDHGNKTSDLYAVNIEFKPQGGFQTGSLNISGPPTLIGIFPTHSAINFQFREGHDYLLFSDYVYADGNLLTVKVRQFYPGLYFFLSNSR
jgi:hypothetical protein